MDGFWVRLKGFIAADKQIQRSVSLILILMGFFFLIYILGLLIAYLMIMVN